MPVGINIFESITVANESNSRVVIILKVSSNEADHSEYDQSSDATFDRDWTRDLEMIDVFI
jgi:hypothetical protein